jgi:hypothetical protein
MAMQPLSTLDIFPTLLSIAGTPLPTATSGDVTMEALALEAPPPPPTLDGRDISALLRTISATEDELMLPEKPLVWYGGDKVLAVRVGAYKVGGESRRVQGGW